MVGYPQNESGKPILENSNSWPVFATLTMIAGDVPEQRFDSPFKFVYGALLVCRLTPRESVPTDSPDEKAQLAFL